MLFQHAVILKSYHNMQLPNHRPGNLDTLSQHAGETNFRSGKPDKLSQYALQNMYCITEAAKAKNSGQADTVK